MCLLLAAILIVGCHPGGSIPNPDMYDGGGGMGGSTTSPCGVDCSGFKAPQCMVTVCNTGQVEGPMNTCIQVPAPNGTGCDDGLFCTVSDFCDNGTCVGGGQNDCNLGYDSCTSTICYEATKSCSATPANDGTACTPKDKCTVNGVCKVGACVGVPKDCSSSPLAECNQMACDPTTGACKATPDAAKDGHQCMFTGDLCKDSKACLSGQCVGGKPKDCSLLNFQCQIGMCDDTSGLCVGAPAPAGTSCTHGLVECQKGACDTKGTCVGSTAADGAPCNDHNACTDGDKCTTGACAGTPIAGCKLFFDETFESCPDGWTLMNDWECGTPSFMSPVPPFSGQGVLATRLSGLYDNLQNISTCTADSPLIDLTTAVNPQLSFWAWMWTNTLDGWNLKISIDGGQSFQVVTSVNPPYPTMIANQPGWSGDLSAKGWQPYSADLTAYIGHSVILRFAFSSDLVGVDPGVYIDQLVVAEPLQQPLYITTTSPLGDAYVDKAYSAPIVKVGGTSGSAWSILPGGTNTAWLKIDPATGVLSGTPKAANVGPVSVTVRVEEPGLPSNFADQTFTFEVHPDVYYTSFEGICPDGWTLTGDWKCGVPTMVGPATAADGTHCIGTGMGANYSNNDTWAGTTATSPPISLVGVPNPTLTFRMWLYTEGGVNDGANLEISDDGGMTFAVVTTVTPAYSPMMIAGQPAWGGNQSALGWQLVQADLTAYSGKTIQLRFGFQSDASTTFPGVYIDDLLVQ